MFTQPWPQPQVEEGGCGGPDRGRSVRTRLSRGNYNPAAAPAYRATSDPSKRVAWEFGRRQRLAGEAFGVAATASAPLLPQGKNGDCWGREGLKTTKRGSCSPPPGACHYSPKQVTVASEPRSAEPLLLSTPSGNSQRTRVSRFSTVLLGITLALWSPGARTKGSVALSPQLLSSSWSH